MQLSFTVAFCCNIFIRLSPCEISGEFENYIFLTPHPYVFSKFNIAI